VSAGAMLFGIGPEGNGSGAECYRNSRSV